MLRLKNQSIFIIFFLVANISFCQTEIKNKIVDVATFQPIENASIYIQNTSIGTVSNTDGKFAVSVPDSFINDTLVISSIGFKTFKIPLNAFDNSVEIWLEEDIASLDEIVLIGENRPVLGNDIVIKALEKLTVNLPDSAYIQKGFLRHKERNNIEFKWLIESAITVLDSGYDTNSNNYLKINVDEVRKSYDLRDVDSLFSFVSYKNQTIKRGKLQLKDIKRSNVSREELISAIKWNDNRVSGLQNLFKGQLNLLRNANTNKALFGDNILKNHQFNLDTILVDNGRKLYKIKITESTDFVKLDTKGIYNDGYVANGWFYIYYDNYAIKRIEYELVAASEAQKIRSKSLFGTQVNHKLVINYMEYEGKMYPNYMYYETPKLVNVGLKSNGKISEKEKERYNKEERYYYTVQEIVFSDIILDKAQIDQAIHTSWDMDIFSQKPYNKDFWKNYNILLESDEEEQLIQDLSQRASLYKN